MEGSVYARHGVDIEAGDNFSQFAASICKQSYNNSPFVQVTDLSNGHFRGPRGCQFINLPDDIFMDIASDGIGTKPNLTTADMNHENSAQDLFAMTGGDITRWGGKPLIFVNVLDTARLGKPGTQTNKAFKRLMEGMGRVAHEQKVVCFRGETAELNVCVGSENPNALTKYNWAGCMLGVYLPDRVITGETLSDGQVVVALRERGPRSNGISAIRGAFREHYGREWWKNPEARDDIRAAAQQSTLYDLFLADANGWTCPVTKPRFKFHLISHISGGGIVDKFGEDLLFRYGFSAVLDDLFEPPPILRKAVTWTGMKLREAYKTFHSGQGALVVLDDSEATPFVSMAREYGIEAKRCGKIIKSAEPYLSIHSGYSDEVLTYPE